MKGHSDKNLKQMNSVGLGAWRILFLFLNLSRKQKFLPEWIPSLCVDLDNWIIASITLESIVNHERAVSLHLLSYLFSIHSILLWLNRKLSLFLRSCLTWQFCLHNQRKKSNKTCRISLTIETNFLIAQEKNYKSFFSHLIKSGDCADQPGLSMGLNSTDLHREVFWPWNLQKKKACKSVLCLFVMQT